MAEPTEQQAKILMQNKWWCLEGMWHTCRVCRKEIFGPEFAWFSPAGAAYHAGCVLQSPQVKRLLGQAAQTKLISD